MRLASIIPSIPERILSALAESGIKTDSDLLFTSGTAADIFLKLPPECPITLREVQETIESVITNTSAPIFRGDRYLELDSERRDKLCRNELNSGVPLLDELVNGFGNYHVLEISGDKGSSKTLLSLQIVLRHLCADQDSSAVWIDTTGGFPSESLISTLEPYADQPGFATALERLQVSLAFEHEQANDILEVIRISHSSGTSPPVRCIVIDSITPLFRPLLSVVSSQGHAIMTTFMRQLRSLAELCSLTILVINSTSAVTPRNPLSAFATTTRKPALGPSFTYMTDATLWLAKWVGPVKGVDNDETSSNSPEDDSLLLVAEILRSRTTTSKTWCFFRVRDGILVAA